MRGFVRGARKLLIKTQATIIGLYFVMDGDLDELFVDLGDTAPETQPQLL